MEARTMSLPPAASHDDAERFFLCRMRNYAVPSWVLPASTAVALCPVRHSFGHLQVLEVLKQFVRRLEVLRSHCSRTSCT
jgi:hypothetical protein